MPARRDIERRSNGGWGRGEGGGGGRSGGEGVVERGEGWRRERTGRRGWMRKDD